LCSKSDPAVFKTSVEPCWTMNQSALCFACTEQCRSNSDCENHDQCCRHECGTKCVDVGRNYNVKSKTVSLLLSVRPQSNPSLPSSSVPVTKCENTEKRLRYGCPRPEPEETCASCQAYCATDDECFVKQICCETQCNKRCIDSTLL
jgi:hypothetical protein